MKEAGLDHWLSPNEGATNESGFTAFPAGQRHFNSTYNLMGETGVFWSSSESSSSNAWNLSLHCNHSSVFLLPFYNKNYGYSIRCLGDY